MNQYFVFSSSHFWNMVFNHKFAFHSYGPFTLNSPIFSWFSSSLKYLVLKSLEVGVRTNSLDWFQLLKKLKLSDPGNGRSIPQRKWGKHGHTYSFINIYIYFLSLNPPPLVSKCCDGTDRHKTPRLIDWTGRSSKKCFCVLTLPSQARAVSGGKAKMG